MSEVDFGPLAALVGTWTGDNGTDVAPEPDGEETTPYFETITIEEVGDVTNAEKQTLAVLSYHQVVSRKSATMATTTPTHCRLLSRSFRTMMANTTVIRG